MNPQTQMQLVGDHLGGSGLLLDNKVGFCCLPTMAAVWWGTLLSLKLRFKQNTFLFVFYLS